MQRANSLEKTLMLRKTEGKRRRGRQWMRWSDSITDSMDIIWVNSRSWWWTGRPGMLRFHGVAKSQTRLSNWTELIYLITFIHITFSISVDYYNKCNIFTLRINILSLRKLNWLGYLTLSITMDIIHYPLLTLSIIDKSIINLHSH